MRTPRQRRNARDQQRRKDFTWRMAWLYVQAKAPEEAVRIRAEAERRFPLRKPRPRWPKSLRSVT